MISKIYNVLNNWRKVRSEGYIHPSVQISSSWISGNVNLAENVEIKDDVRISGEVSIGERTAVFGPNTQIYSRINPISIGKYCSIARGTTFQEYNHKFHNVSTYMINSKLFGKSVETDLVSKGAITVGNDVWIGAHCVILSGVTIGNGAVVAANSVVTKNIEPYSIVAGSPTVEIGRRFSEGIISLLEELKWWDRGSDWMNRNMDFFDKEPSIGSLKKLLNEL